MRVLHLNTHSSGGSYECAALLCQALSAEGIKSELYCKTAPRTQGFRRILDRVVRRSYVSLSREPWHGTRRLLCPPGRKELDGIDVVHLHTVADWFDVPAWLEKLPGRICVVVSVHDMWHFTGGCFLYRGCNLFSNTCAPCPILKTPLNRVLAKDEQRRKLRAYRDRRVQFVANSQWLAALAEQSPIVRACGGVRVISPGIDTSVFKPQDKIKCRTELGLSPDVFVIAAGAASLTDKNKNVPWLLEQLAQLSNPENLLVVLAGEGAVEIPIGLNVRLMGNVPGRSKRATIFGAADVFVSASLMETYGLTLIEAMSCGRPVVAFRTGGIPEAVRDGEAGILCDVLDGAAFRGAIENLRSCRQLRDDMGAAASSLIASRNSKAAFAVAFARVYQECVDVARTPSTGQGSRSSPLQYEKETKTTKDFVESYNK